MEQEKYKQLNNKEPTPEELERINQEVESQMQAMTPEEVKTYMSRKHQDPAEVLGNQLLEALMIQTDFKLKAEKALENGLIGRRPIIYVGIMNGEPELWVINPTRFYFEKNPDDPFIENSECAICEYHMLPSDVVKNFGEELTKDEINLLYSPTGDQIEQKVLKILDREDSPTVFDLGSEDTVLVKHYVWKSLRKIGFLTYLDEENIEREDIVSEEYKLDTSIGDISIEWKWIPEVYETWKINDSFVRMRPIPGQFKDLDNLYQCKLPYYGVDFGSSLVDALKVYQYLFDVLMFKVELLVSSDKGKKLLMNINAVPNSASIEFIFLKHLLYIL